MKSRNLMVLSVVFVVPVFVNAMRTGAPSVMTMSNDNSVVRTIGETESRSEHIDSGMMRALGYCFNAGDRASKKICRCCLGQELPMSVSCQCCSYCSTQLLFWSLLVRSREDFGVRHHWFTDVCALSAGSSVCLAYLAHKAESVYGVRRTLLAESRASEPSKNSAHKKAE